MLTNVLKCKFHQLQGNFKLFARNLSYIFSKVFFPPKALAECSTAGKAGKQQLKCRRKGTLPLAPCLTMYSKHANI